MHLPTPDELDHLSGSIDCPITWCEGLRSEHGGEGGSPDTWLHSGSDRALSDLALGFYSAEGSAGRSYHLALSVDADFDSAELSELATRLRTLAAELDVRSASL